MPARLIALALPLAVSGLFVISVCYIGVNLLGIGLHSYGWFFDS